MVEEEIFRFQPNSMGNSRFISPQCELISLWAPFSHTRSDSKDLDEVERRIGCPIKSDKGKYARTTSARDRDTFV